MPSAQECLNHVQDSSGDSHLQGAVGNGVDGEGMGMSGGTIGDAGGAAGGSQPPAWADSCITSHQGPCVGCLLEQEHAGQQRAVGRKEEGLKGNRAVPLSFPLLSCLSGRLLRARQHERSGFGCALNGAPQEVKMWSSRGSNPGLPACEAGALPLSYSPDM